MIIYNVPVNLSESYGGLPQYIATTFQLLSWYFPCIPNKAKRWIYQTFSCHLVFIYCIVNSMLNSFLSLSRTLQRTLRKLFQSPHVVPHRKHGNSSNSGTWNVTQVTHHSMVLNPKVCPLSCASIFIIFGTENFVTLLKLQPKCEALSFIFW
jgi:hypothetical protein